MTTPRMMPIGRPRFASVNRLLQERAEAGPGPLIVAHRGSGRASIAENTARAFTAALREGADMIETDVTRSSDGGYFLFHDGYERMHFGLAQDIRELTTAQISELRYRWCVEPGAGDYAPEPLGTILHGFDDVLFNIDRSWPYWPELLPCLAQHDVAQRFVLKSPVTRENLDALAASPVPFPYMPIVRRRAEIDLVLSYEEINTVAVELLAPSVASDLADPALVPALQAQGLLVQLCALNLGNRVPMFLGWDDEVSIEEGPEAGWGKLIAHGADLVQTDWPGLLHAHRRSMRG